MTVTQAGAPLRLEQVDGLRVLWAPGPGPRSQAGLVFRVGQADESLINRGITHLLEHLALVGTDVSVNHNGQTDLLTTTFTVTGTLAEIDAHLARVTSSLAALPTARLDVEKQILRAEEEGSGQGMFERLAVYRYGASGIGLTAYPEWGLDRIDAAALAQWSQRYFTAENAVLVVVGPERPEQLGWTLPTGTPQPAALPAPIAARLPSFAFDGVPGPGLMVEVPRSNAATAYAAILNRELMRVVRGERGLAYRASAGYLPLSADRAVVMAQTDSIAEQEQQTVDAFLDVLFALAADGPDARMLADVVSARAEALEDPQAVFGLAHNSATELLLGQPLPDFSELAREDAALTAREIQHVAVEVARSATVLIPGQARALGRGGFTQAGAADATPVTGHRVSLPTESGQVPVDLIIGVEGVSRVRGDQTMTVRYTDLAALLRRPDGRRVLIATSGDTIVLDPSVVDPARIDLVDVASGADRWVTLPGPAAAPASPAQPPAHPNAAAPNSAALDAAAPAAEPAAPKQSPAPKPVEPVAPLTTFQRFVVRPLRAIGVALLVLFVFAMVWPATADDSFVPPGDVLLFLLPVVAATADNVLYARRARRRNQAEAAHRALQSRPSQEQSDGTGARA